MKCSACGAEIPNGSAFCTTCGTPAPIDNSDENTTVLVNSSAMTPQQPQMGQPAFNQQPQMGQPAFNQQPQMGMQQMGQSMQPQMGMQQMGQPMQPQMGMQQMGQPMQPQMGMQQMGQPMRPQQPKAPRKPMTPQQKKILMFSIIGVAALLLIFLVIVPLLTRAKLKGSYKLKDDRTIVFDNGTYVIYDDTDSLDTIIEAGYYEVSGKTITMKSILESDTDTATFNKKRNTVKFKNSSNVYKSANKKAKLGFTLSKKFVKELQEEIEDDLKKATKDEDFMETLTRRDYSFNKDDLSADERDDDDVEEIAMAINYDNNKALSLLMEKKYIQLNIYFKGENTKPDVSIYRYYDYD